MSWRITAGRGAEQQGCEDLQNTGSSRNVGQRPSSSQKRLTGRAGGSHILKQLKITRDLSPRRKDSCWETHISPSHLESPVGLVRRGAGGRWLKTYEQIYKRNIPYLLHFLLSPNGLPFFPLQQELNPYSVTLFSKVCSS